MQAALDHGAIPKKIKAIPINKLMSELLSHRLRHQDRQLSSLQISKDGILNVNGPQSRTIRN